MDKKKRPKKFYIMNGRSIRKLEKQIPMMIFIIMFFIGMLIGVIMIKQRAGESAVKNISILLKAFIQIREHQSFLINFSNILSASVIFLIFSALMGYSAIGVPFIMLIPFFKGLLLGLLTAEIYTGSGLQGAAYCMLILYPSNILSTLALMLSCRESCDLSMIIFKNEMTQHSGKEQPDIKKNNLKQGAYLLVVAAAAIFEALMSTVFSGYFSIL